MNKRPLVLIHEYRSKAIKNKFARSVNQPVASWVALWAKWTLISFRFNICTHGRWSVTLLWYIPYYSITLLNMSHSTFAWMHARHVLGIITPYAPLNKSTLDNHHDISEDITSRRVFPFQCVIKLWWCFVSVCTLLKVHYMWYISPSSSSSSASKMALSPLAEGSLSGMYNCVIL